MSKIELVELLPCPRCNGTGKVRVVRKVKEQPKKQRPEPLLPLSDALKAALPGMTRSQRYQAIRMEHGICIQCGKERISPESKRLGEKCLRKQRLLMRELKGFKARRKKPVS